MNEIVNKCFVAGDTFMPEMHLRQPRFIYSVCGPLTKNKERIQTFKERGDSRYIIKTSWIMLIFNKTLLMEISKI